MIAALSAWHERHDAAAQALESVDAVPAHVAVEVYAVLTRLPSGLAVPASVCAGVLARRFGQTQLYLDDSRRSSMLERFAAAGVFGGATYDGLVALEAEAHGRTLLTLDQRARATYQRLGVAFSMIGGSS